ncbi:hypothetical protein BBJ28_00011722 [Nothophytophthora sp. Chile5]|nr:hypothetical protein BBJ28_00011722 [Nothophytophthora sp. Chile5]
MDLHGAMDDTLALFDVSGATGYEGLADDLDMTFLAQLLQESDPVPEPSSPLSTASSEEQEAAVPSSPSGHSDTTEGSDADDEAPNLPRMAAPLMEAPQAEDASEMKAEDRKAKRRAQVAISARRHRSRKKNEMISLKKEVNYLNFQLDFLRSKHKLLRADGAVAEWEEKAIAQRHKRRQAEELNDQLRHALFVQSGYVRNLKSVFAFGSPLNVEINMRRFLHTYTHLRTDSQSRARDFAAICTDAKLEMGMQTVLRETEGIPFSSPHISTRQISTSSTEFGATTLAVYAFDTMNTPQIFLAACGAILGCGSAWPGYTQVNSYGKVVDAPSDSIRYGLSGCRYRSDDEKDEVVVESRGLSYYRLAQRCGVLLWDYVDDDDLYPMLKNTQVKRDVIGTVVVRPEICADGVERVVCRSICTKVHSVNLSKMSSDVRRFSESKKMGAQICGSMVYETIIGHCPDKEATYLSSQLDFLRSKHNMLRDDGSVAEWTDAAISQRHKRRQAEQLNEQLRQALFEQSGFVRSVKAAFPRPILPNMELNMCTLLHMYTHLSKDPHSRVRDLKAVCNNAKLDLARQIVLSETESLPFATPTIEWRQLDMRGVKGFGVTTVAVYAFNTRDAKKVFQATCDTILGFGGVWPSYSLVNSSAQVVDRPPTEHHIRYGVSKHLYQSDITGDQVVVEGRELSCSRLTGRGGVFCWDHVDVDDLHPLKESTAVRCNRTGAVVVRPEICEDGVERVVCRNICTKVHTVDVSKLTKHVAQFSRSRLQGVQACGSMVYEIIKEEASEVSTEAEGVGHPLLDNALASAHKDLPLLVPEAEACVVLATGASLSSEAQQQAISNRQRVNELLTKCVFPPVMQPDFLVSSEIENHPANMSEWDSTLGLLGSDVAEDGALGVITSQSDDTDLAFLSKLMQQSDSEVNLVDVQSATTSLSPSNHGSSPGTVDSDDKYDASISEASSSKAAASGKEREQALSLLPTENGRKEKQRLRDVNNSRRYRSRRKVRSHKFS